MTGLRLWGVVLAIGATDLVWARIAGLSFGGCLLPTVSAAACLGLAVVYDKMRPAPALAELARCAAIWIGFTGVGCALTYVAASVARPLVDAALADRDAMLGFDWVAWANQVHRHPSLTLVLRCAYASLPPQIMGSILFLALARVPGRNDELLLNSMLALVLTTLISALWPALGPWVQFGDGAALPGDTVYVADVLALRSGGPARFALSAMRGIVTFPSYHTVLAILLTYSHRGLTWSFPPILAVNALMLMSLPSEGGHYLTDMLAGSVVAICVIAVTGQFRRGWIVSAASRQLARSLPKTGT